MQLLLPFHIAFMAIALIMIILAGFIARKRGKNWLRFHKIFAGFGIFSVVVATGSIIVLKQLNHFPHFKSDHALIGLIAIIFFIVTPILGILATKGSAKIRFMHKLLGRIAIGVMTLTVFSGIFRFLQISKII